MHHKYCKKTIGVEVLTVGVENQMPKSNVE
jgi:hypothetical protein